MALEIFRLVGSIFVDNDAANRSIGKTDEKAQGVGKSLANGVKTAGKWGAAIVAGAAAAATGAAALSKTFVDSYADYEQLTGGVETLFKDSAGMVMQYAENAYKTAGMTANQYMETVTSFSASLLQGLNGDTAKAAKVADMAITDMSDNANKMGTDISSIQNAYQGFAKQNYTMLDNLKLGYGGTKTEMERLLKDASKLTGQKYDISNLNDVYEAIHAVQTEMGITGTTAKEAKSTISGSVNAMKAQFENIKTTIGSALAPTIMKVLNLISDRMPQIEALFEKMTPILTELMDKLIPPLLDLADQIFPVILELLESIMPTLSQIIQEIMPIIQEILAQILPFLVELVQKILPVLFRIIQAILPIIEELLPLLGPILELIMALLDPLIELLDFILPPILKVIQAVVHVISVVLKPIIVWLKDFLGGALSGAVKGFKAIIEAIPKAFQAAWSGIKSAWSAVTGWFSSLGEGIKNVFSRVGEAICNIFKVPINWIINGINFFIRGINKIKIPDWVPLIGGKGFSIKEIPTLAQGGVLEKGQTGFLEGNGAEAVVPLHNNRKWVNAVADDMEEATGGLSGKRVEAKLADILAALEELLGMGVYLDTGALVGGLARPMDKKLGQIAAQKARA